MEPSTSELALQISAAMPLLPVAAIACAAIAAVILLWFLLMKPRLVASTKVLLLFGLGVFPIAAAFSGNVVGFQHTTTRDFCSSCHTMTPYTDDAANPDSDTLPALHSRNESFGYQSCYVCHSDYGMFGTVTTKLAGMLHVWEYYTSYRNIPIEEALPTIHLYDPFPNKNCTQCHSTTLPGWRDVDEHEALMPELDRGEIGCASEGCHGPAHPFSKGGAP